MFRFTGAYKKENRTQLHVYHMPLRNISKQYADVILDTATKRCNVKIDFKMDFFLDVQCRYCIFRITNHVKLILYLLSRPLTKNPELSTIWIYRY
jgi:hypothetical protein